MMFTRIGERGETKYHIIMAIGESNCQSCLPNLLDMVNLKDLDPMVKVAIADSITRLQNSSSFLSFSLKKLDEDFVTGALRGMTFNQIPLPMDIIDHLIDFSLSFEENMVYFWLAAAAPNCKSKKLINHLKLWSTSINEDVSKAANAALENKYLKWSIL